VRRLALLAIAALAAGHALGRWKQGQERPVRWKPIEADPVGASAAQVGGWIGPGIQERCAVPERFLRPPARSSYGTIGCARYGSDNVE